MFVSALVITTALGALFASGVLLRYAVIGSGRPWRISIGIGLYAAVALLASVKFCHDVVVYRDLWNDESSVIALLNYLGILMINAHGLLLVVLGCGWLYWTSASRVAKQDTPAG